MKDMKDWEQARDEAADAYYKWCDAVEKNYKTGEMTDFKKCGICQNEAILADTEDWAFRLCNPCYEDQGFYRAEKLEAILKIAEQKLDEHLPELIGKTTRGPVYLDLLNVWTDIKKALKDSYKGGK